MGKIIRNEKIITPTQYIEKVDETLIKQLIDGTITEIIIPDGVDIIHSYAFYHQTFLETIKIPKSVKYVGYDYLYDSDTYPTASNGLSFDTCSKLKSLDLSNVEFVRTYQICQACKNLESIKFKSDCKFVQDRLEDYAFNACEKLNYIELPDEISAIGATCFSGCYALKELKKGWSNITSIGHTAFQFCNSLDMSELPESVTSININSFVGCSSLKWKYLPSGITEISYGTFNKCIGLTEMTFKGDITIINGSAFADCTNLTKFTFPNNTVVPTLSNVSAIPNGASYTGQIAIPNSLYDSWTTKTNWVSLTKAQWVRFIDSWDEAITVEGDYALKTDTDLADVRHLTPIRTSTGLYKTKTNILIKSWDRLIADNDITITDGKLRVVNTALNGDLLCESVENLTSLSGAFNNCASLTGIDISNFNTSNVTSMVSMFYGCSSLTTLNLSSFDTSKVVNMSEMFSSCVGLTNLEVSNFDTSKVINMSNMFAGCNTLTTLDLSSFTSNEISNISSMFYLCRALTNLDISNFDFTVNPLFDDAFSNIPTACEILVKDEANKSWINTNFPALTNVKVKGE